MPVLSTLGAAIANVYGFTSGLIKDQYFNLVSLLLPGNGTNGAQNNTFLDSSTNNFTITRNGDTTQGTFSPFSQTGWGAYFDGSNDNVSFASGSQIIPATSDFTIEAWVYPTSVAAGVYNVIYAQTNGGASAGRTSFQTDGSNIAFQCAGTYLTSSSGTVIANRWNYVAATRTGSSVSLYVNGSATTGLTASGSIDSGTSLTAIGVNWSPQYMAGYISNFRVSTTIRSNLTTVPTSPFTNDASTRVLTLQNNRFIDNSSSPFTLTANNGVAITPFSPFAPTSSYSAAAVGGSGYFDGSGDSLTTPNVTALNLYNTTNTVECWVYPLSFSSDMQIYGTDFDGTYYTVWRINGTTGYPRYLSRNGTSIAGSTGLTLNQWNHVAWGRSGTTVSIWLNGTRVANGTITTEDQWGTGVITTGRFNNGDYLNGYLSGLRVVKGSDVYGVSNTSITVPTTPFTAITNTAYLLNFTNAGVVDATAKNDLQTVGNAQISTTQSKWGTGSIAFDGTGDYLLAPVDANQNYNFGTGDFTVECWFYANSLSSTSYAGLMGCNNANVDGNTSAWAAYVRSNGIFFYGSTGTLTGVAGTVNTGVWNHYAVTRSGNTLRLFLNGTQTTSATVTGSYTNSTVGFRVGDEPDSSNPAFNGYIDDLRITKGYARYVEGTGGNAGKMVFNGTNTLALPTAPFPLQ